MHRALFLTLLFAVTSLPVLITSPPTQAASIFDRYFSGSHLNFELSDDTITDTSKFEAELELRYRDGDLSAFTRLTNDRPFAFQTEPFEIQKRGFSYRHDEWRLTGGDFSLTLGRGTALDATEDREVDRDSQLDGAMIEGEMGLVELTAFWGRHKSDHADSFVSGINTGEADPADELWGARLDFDFDELDLCVSWIDADIALFGSSLTTTVTEIDASWRIDDISLYYETVWFNRDEPEWYDESMDGRAQLAELLYAHRGVSLSGAWVRYDEAEFDYGTAPSLRRIEVDHSQARPNDETGYRFDCRLSPPTWDGHALRALYTDLNGIHQKGQGFRNIFVEWSSPVTGEWSTSLSYDRVSGLLLNYGAIPGSDESYRMTLDGPFLLGGSFHFYGRYRLLESRFQNDDEVELGCDWNISPDFTLGFFRETSTRDIEPPPPGLIGIPTDSPGQWNSMFVHWTPDPWTQVELLIGSRRGGFQCSGGVCAQLPPFKGVSFSYYRVL